jgi:protein-S-isoprenylcysteine O-methyltransferase Ste14
MSNTINMSRRQLVVMWALGLFVFGLIVSLWNVTGWHVGIALFVFAAIVLAAGVAQMRKRKAMRSS